MFVAMSAAALIVDGLFRLTECRGVTDPVYGMKVDRALAVRADFAGETFYFCSQHCAHTFEIDPGGYLATNNTTPPTTRIAGAHPRH